MIKPILTAIICLITLFFESGISNAGNLALGRLKSRVCGKCHGIEGNSTNPEIPNLAGQPQYYLLQQFNEFKSGKRKHPGMNKISAVLSESNMDDIAAYYAGQKPLEVKGEPSLAATGKMSYRLCESCHKANGAGFENVPRLAGQHISYTSAQLKAYREGTRKETLMSEVSRNLSDDEIEALAEYTFYLR